MKAAQSHGDGRTASLRVRTRVRLSRALESASERIKPKVAEMPQMGDEFTYHDRVFKVTGTNSPMWDDTRDPLTFDLLLESWDHDQ